MAGVFALPVALRFLLDLIGASSDPSVGLFTGVILLLIWATVSLPLYLYIALSGGIMDRAARQRYRNEGTPGPS